MRKLKTLKRVKDRFSLFNDGRKIGANKRKYIVQAVQKMIQSAQTQELLRVGEAYGYYGHQPRQRAKKLELGETEVIMINGRPVVVENVPSNRTISISCSDDGIVEHEEEFLILRRAVSRFHCGNRVLVAGAGRLVAETRQTRVSPTAIMVWTT